MNILINKLFPSLTFSEFHQVLNEDSNISRKLFSINKTYWHHRNSSSNNFKSLFLNLCVSVCQLSIGLTPTDLVNFISKCMRNFRFPISWGISDPCQPQDPLLAPGTSSFLKSHFASSHYYGSKWNDIWLPSKSNLISPPVNSGC